jgi:hypothetical protein
VPLDQHVERRNSAVDVIIDGRERKTRMAADETRIPDGIPRGFRENVNGIIGRIYASQDATAQMIVIA